MLSEEDIWEIAIPSNYEDSPQGYTISFARAIEAAVLAEKQEPVKDEPVARKIKYGSLVFLEGYHELPDGTLLYARPQPDLTAEVERLREELRIYHDADAKAATQIHQQAQRIAELEEAAREALVSVRGIADLRNLGKISPEIVAFEAIAKLDAVLGNESGAVRLSDGFGG